ncbi:hypothetical protein B0T26DRAFT_730108 [Lasiosphaeria miniovina]|uniref:Uncharacterized protein n=1 Tax=Lasiosphaeria miniovina TaxID=1954250 RepID=A0AA39ZT62_9PEZI|nr:uncharacterized protein B0T26DRAFT_730108 [Lasiosphaeria miniovina]KAK0703187.1 hypothetical protein B0T26DRAFT_730108 [Lasiosphaeria miniovina]
MLSGQPVDLSVLLIQTIPSNHIASLALSNTVIRFHQKVMSPFPLPLANNKPNTRPSKTTARPTPARQLDASTTPDKPQQPLACSHQSPTARGPPALYTSCSTRSWL